MLLAFAATIAWGVSLALVDDGLAQGLLRGVSSPNDFLRSVTSIPAPGPFLDTFVERIEDYTVHVEGHPPGLVLALWWMRAAGVGGAVPLVTVVIAAGGIAVTSVLVALREVAGEDSARRAAPFLVLSPAAVWLVSSADALYAAAGAIGASAVVMATARSSDAYAALGGLAFGAGLFVSYGLGLVAAVPLAVAVARRRLRPLLVAGPCAAAVGVGFAAFGFSWLEGLAATRREYAESVAAHRPYAYFLVANLAAFAIVLGPAPARSHARPRSRPSAATGAGPRTIAKAARLATRK